MKTIARFKDRHGVGLRCCRWGTDTTICLAKSFGYELIAVPPWPEWNPNGCFFCDIDNFDTYFSLNSKTAVLLPVGTLSVKGK